MHHDALLKSILESLANRLVPHLLGARPVEPLNVEFSSVRRRLPDFVSRLNDGRILHLEIQASNDARMPHRMLEYWLLLRNRYPESEIVQAVLYVGNPRLTMIGGFAYTALHYTYSLHDIREIDPEVFLNSPLPTERVLAVLCRNPNPLETVRAILKSWSGAPKNEWADLNQKLMLISGLRDLEQAVTEEARKMPLTIDIIKNNKVVQEWMRKGHAEGFERGREEGREEGQLTVLRRQIERKFGRVPRWAENRLKSATLAQIDDWSLRILDAPTLKDMLR